MRGINFRNVVLVNANLSRASLEESKGLLEEKRFYESIALSPDDSFLVAGGIEGIVKLWFNDDKSNQIIAKNMTWITCIAVSNDNRLVAIGDNTGHIVVYDVRATETILQIHDHDDCMADLAFDRDTQRLITVSGGNPPDDNSIRVYNLPDGQLIWHYKHKEAFKELAYCSKSNILITADWQSGVDLWDIENKRKN